MTLYMQGPPPRSDGSGPKPNDLLGGEIETENEAEDPSGQAPPAASLADADVDIDDINSEIAEANDAIERALDAIGEANSAITAANSLIGLWSERHPGGWLDPIAEIDVEIEAIDEIDEVEAEEDG